MITWEALRTHALVGTSRRPTGELTAVGRPVGDDVLAAAALLGAERRAGRRAGSCPRAAEPAPPEALREPPEPASQLLEVLVGGALGRAAELDVLVARWMEACVAHGCRLPARLVVPALRLATERSALRTPTAAVLGATGTWLAAAHPDWRWAATPDDPSRDEVDDGADTEEWARLPRAARAEALADRRRRDPTAGRDLLASTWGTDKAIDRAALLEQLAVGLGPDDEALLEAALDDRSIKVREAAWTLLDRLPSSARAGRMADRLRPLIAVEGRLRPSLVVELPDALDASAERDGLVTGRSDGGSRRLAWLRTLVRAAPLRTWEETTGRSPERLVALRSDPPELVDMLVDATVAQRDPTWAAALLEREPRGALVPLVAGQTARTALERHLSAGRAAAPVVGALGALAGAWTPALSVAVVERLRRAVSAKEAGSITLVTAAVPTLVAHLDPSVVPHLERWRDGGVEDVAVDAALRSLVQHLSTLDSIDQAFAEGART